MTIRNSIYKITSWLLPVCILLVSTALVLMWLWVPSYLSERLSEHTTIRSEGKYKLQVDEMKTKLFPFSIQLNGISLEPQHIETANSDQPNEVLYQLSASELKIEGINTRLLLTDKTLSGKKLTIRRPEVRLAGEALLQLDSMNISSSSVKNLWPLLGFIEKVSLDKIELDEANFGFYSTTGDSAFISKASRVGIAVRGFTASSKMEEKTGRLFETEDILVQMYDFKNDMGDSLHYLTIDTLYYSLKTTNINVHGFNLRPYSLDPDFNLIEVRVPEVHLKSKSITHFALEDSLSVGNLHFVDPQIRFYRNKASQKVAIESIDEFDLYSLVRNQFTRLEVDSFYLQGAQLEIFHQPDLQNYRQQFESIDIVLNGFELDSTSNLNPRKLFHADNLEMHVRGYHLKMEANLHQFSAGSLFASTYSNQLIAEKIKIHPDPDSRETIRNEIRIACSALKIDEVDFLKLYHNRILPTTNIVVDEPNVHLLYNMEKEKKSKKENNRLLYDLVTDYLQGVYSKNVHLLNGRLNIQNNFKDEIKGYFETDIHFHLSEFSIDSASIIESDNFFYASNFDLQFNNYNMRLIDDFHKLEVDSISISSYNDQIQINNLQLQPVTGAVNMDDFIKSGRTEMYNVSVPNIKLQSVDLNNAFFNRKIQIEHFTITQPKIYLENLSQQKNDNDTPEISEIYRLILGYADDININKFRINNGMLTWINHTKKGSITTFDNEFSATLTNFSFNQDVIKNDKLFFSDHFELTIKDQEFELSDDVHILKGNEIYLSSSESSIKIKDAHLYPLITSDKYTNLATTWQVTIPEININGFDFNKAYYSQEPEINKVELVRPQFQMYIQSGKTKTLDLKNYNIPMPSFIESLNIAELKVTNGEAVTFRKEGIKHHAMANFFFNLSVPGLKISRNEEQQIRLNSTDINLDIENFKLPTDSIHNLYINKIAFNKSQQSLYIDGLNLIPFISDNRKNRFLITAPSIKFNSFNLEEALENNDFIFSKIEATNPEISIKINSKPENDSVEFLQTLDLYPYVDQLVNSLQVDNLEIKDAQLNLQWMQKPIINNKVNLSFKGIRLNEENRPTGLFNSESFVISANSIIAHSSDDMYKYSVESMVYESVNNKVLLNNLEILPLTNRKEFHLKQGYQTDVVEAKIEYVELEGINELKYLRENVVDAKALVIGPADVDIFRDKRFPFDQRQHPEWPQNLIKNLKQPFVFDSVYLLPSTIRYSELLPIFDDPGVIEFSELMLKGNRLTNIQSERKQDELFIIDAWALLQQEGALQARFEFDLNSPLYEHSVEGTLGAMNLKSLNSMIMKSAPVFIESGRLNRMDFRIDFRGNIADGEINLMYDNLKVAVYDYSGEEIRKSNVVSFLANNLKINSHNRESSKPRNEEIQFERDESRSVINFWWKSLYSGIVKFIGI